MGLVSLNIWQFDPSYNDHQLSADLFVTDMQNTDERIVMLHVSYM